MDSIVTFLVQSFAVILALVVIWLIIGPPYRVWARTKEGQAALAEAEYEQQIQRARADGRLNAARKNKEAAIIEAEAVAAQIKEIGEHLTQHELYLRWQWIKMMEDRDSEADTIYVATEAGLPILEATRRQNHLRPPLPVEDDGS